MSYLLQEDGGKIILESGDGFLLLELDDFVRVPRKRPYRRVLNPTPWDIETNLSAGYILVDNQDTSG